MRPDDEAVSRAPGSGRTVLLRRVGVQPSCHAWDLNLRVPQGLNEGSDSTEQRAGETVPAGLR
jgi:hypothetical protein